MARAFAHILYLLAAFAIAASIPLQALGQSKSTWIVIGVIGAWRYSWALTNFARGALFLKWKYPRRKQASQTREKMLGQPRHAFVMITSYKIDPEVTAQVYRDLFAACARAGQGATIVASVVDPADERLIRRVYEATARRATTRLLIDRIPGTGKRDAIARSLDLLRRQNPTRHDIVAFIDGDTCVPEDLFAQVSHWFSDPQVGALTTDEIAETGTDGLFQKWFDLRFDQRQAMMCSMGVSERVLTLTGRMSVFRACLATDSSFIDRVQHDAITHWRFGQVRFLTGDDKSTWFWLLERGYKMLYLPDIACLSFESPPRASFIGSAFALMTRWYGNMLRTNLRASRVRPKAIGLFTWWSLRDQVLSIWTTLSGPIATLLATVFVTPYALLAYISWVMITRYIYCAIIGALRGASFPALQPFLLYFSQIVGAATKSYVFFRINRQKWTRQAASGAGAVTWSDRFSAYLHVLAIGWLIAAIALVSVPV